MNDFQRFIKFFEVTGVKYQIMESFKLKIEDKLVERGIIVYGRVENLENGVIGGVKSAVCKQ
jgi:hypothetical protein